MTAELTTRSESQTGTSYPLVRRQLLVDQRRASATPIGVAGSRDNAAPTRHDRQPLIGLGLAFGALLRVANVAIRDPSEAALSVTGQSALMVGPCNAALPSHRATPDGSEVPRGMRTDMGFRHVGGCREDGTLLQQFE